MTHARGDIILTIDGDLQDPPELIDKMVEKLEATPYADVIFACKTRRDDPWWFIIGMTIFRAVQDTLSPVPLPPGAGAYCAMRRELAKRAAAVPRKMVNLAPVLCSLGAKADCVPYEKLARYDNESRVGPLGLLQEAIGSLAVTGALRRLMVITAVVVAALVAITWAMS